MGSGMKATKSEFKGFAIVKDKYGRIVVDEEIFFDKQKLEQLRREVIKNGRNT